MCNLLNISSNSNSNSNTIWIFFFNYHGILWRECIFSLQSTQRYLIPCYCYIIFWNINFILESLYISFAHLFKLSPSELFLFFFRYARLNAEKLDPNIYTYTKKNTLKCDERERERKRASAREREKIARRKWRQRKRVIYVTWIM